MDEKEKFRAEMDAKLKLMGTTLDKLIVKWETRKENRPNINFEGLKTKKEKANAKLMELVHAGDDDKYKRVKSDILHMMNDIDDELRSAMTYLIH